jgi:quaternary ammonium compound-resistance protein SugE
MIAGIPVGMVVLVVLVVITQVIGGTLLPRTEGFRNVGWTLACMGTYTVSIGMLAETIRQGAALSLIMPVLAALVPLATIVVAVMFLGEQASWLRLGILSGACVLIGVAATV